jgi:V/A-type H+-transporting ATPase subunit I
MSSVAMRKLELLVLRRDIDSVLEFLGEEGCFQLTRDEGSQVPGTAREDDDARAGQEAALTRLTTALVAAGIFLGLEDSGVIAPGTKPPDAASLDAAEAFSNRCGAMESEMKSLRSKGLELAAAKREAGAFAGLSIPFEDLGRMSFLSLRIGSIESGTTEKLAEALGDRALILPLDDKGRIVAASSHKGRFALDTELARVGFARQEFPAAYSGIPPEVGAALESAIVENDGALEKAEGRRLALAGESAKLWETLLASVRIGLALGRVRDVLKVSGWVYRLSGWVPANRVEVLVSGLERRCADRVAVRSFIPEELDSVVLGNEDVPGPVLWNAPLRGSRSYTPCGGLFHASVRDNVRRPWTGSGDLRRRRPDVRLPERSPRSVP